MDIKELLIDFHKRAHQSLALLIKHCEQFSETEINREFEGFGVSSIRESLHHMITAERYWIGVPQGRIDAEDDLELFPTIASLRAKRSNLIAYLENRDCFVIAFLAKTAFSDRLFRWDDEKEQDNPPLIPALQVEGGVVL